MVKQEKLSDMILEFGESTKYINIYYNICINNERYKYGDTIHKHHFLPRSMFPEYENFNDNPWNCIEINARTHYILHLLLGFHFRKIGKYIEAYTSFRSVTNFAGSSRHYELFRKNLSNIMVTLWKDNEWRKDTIERMSSAANRRYENPEERQKASIIRKEWYNSLDENQLEEFKRKISNGMSNMTEAEKAMAAEKSRVFMKSDAGKEVILKTKKTLNSEEYKKNNFITCEYCNKLHSPGNYSRYHGEKCKMSPLYIKKEEEQCDVCDNWFVNLNNHKIGNKNCSKDFFKCISCDRGFTTKKGLTIHRKKCNV